jgi:hypothetical protein
VVVGIENIVLPPQSLLAVHRHGNELLSDFLIVQRPTPQEVLEQTNSLDFAHLQKCAYNLLTDTNTFAKVTQDIRSDGTDPFTPPERERLSMNPVFVSGFVLVGKKI